MFFKHENSSDSVVWRNASGRIDCPGDDCPQDCDDRCPIWLNTSGLEQLLRNRPGDAIEIFQKAISIAPDFHDAHSNLGTAYGMSGRHKEAYDAFSKALELRKDYPQALRGLISAEKNLGMYEEALAHCDAYELLPGCSAQELRGQIERLAGKSPADDAERTNWLLVAEKLLKIGRGEGYIQSEGFPQIPELMILAERVSKQILMAAMDCYERAHNIHPFLVTFAWAAYAGIGAVFHWNLDWGALSSAGVYETMTRERGFGEMDEYVLDTIGLPFGSDEAMALGKFLYEELSPKCMLFVDPDGDSLDADAVIRGAKAMYAYGVVYEMNRLGMM